ncbi:MULTISPECIES: LysR family transcriptional regulator [Ensifer]|uniref:LysR family transcriptional regulator n=1 Tax=Ensifer adhaerens TaxID=106592 RepID=A0ABY8HCP1_ENSAD|nr:MULTISPECIES: LysR family transcriptional regulator [Ensifer]ANK73269.1 LysR family transcriptional regulator [Ensifer adhaerens]KDP76136.1 LysR family transcriptional regulator [Ensifer adhaerens]KQX26505.1 LysR family transcriptional regulator [Ensifer sp. Root423]KQZ57338.1 LysR family transcriptional regulator [Ensifer sp. Root558]MBD9541205.1 LysR family transcriptional regulator [Ensifer sp. ENS04]
MDRQEAMTVFLAVVEEGDFSAAARRLRMTPSAVSKIVGRLEARLGVRLLQRSTRSISLTSEGSAYAESSRRILGDMEDAEVAIQPGAVPRGRLRVSLPSAFGHRLIVPMLPDFIERFPEIDLELDFSDAVVDLMNGEADVALRVAEQSDSTLVTRRLAPNRRVICAAPAYLERHGAPQTPDDLQRHVCLAITARGRLNVWEFQDGDGRRAIRVCGSVEANSTEALRRLALAGIGIVRLSELLVGGDIKAGLLVPLLTGSNYAEAEPITVVYPHRRFLPPRVRVFVDFLAEQFARRPWEEARFRGEPAEAAVLPKSRPML